MNWLQKIWDIITFVKQRQDAAARKDVDQLSKNCEKLENDAKLNDIGTNQPKN